MRKILILGIFAIISVVLLGCGTTDEQYRTMIALAGSGSDTVVVIEKDSRRVVMKIGLPERDAECNSVEVDKNGSVLFSYRRGARLVSRYGDVVWDMVRVAEDDEFQSASLLSGGGYLIGVCGKPSKIYELNDRGDRSKIINFETGIESIHGQFRQVRKSFNGNYLVPLMARNETLEINDSGRVINVFPYGGFSLVELSSGNLLIPQKEGKIVEVNRVDGSLVREIDVPTSSFLTEIFLLDSGNLLLTNWQGYRGKDKECEWMAIELDKSGNVVWEFKDDTLLRNVSAIYQYEGLVVDSTNLIIGR